MSKYGDTNKTNSIDSSDVDTMLGIMRTTLDNSFGSAGNRRAFFDMDIDENPNTDLNDSINEFSKLNVHRKFAFAGPAAHELLKLNHIADGNLPEEEYNDADYDFSVGSKGANVDMHNTDFVASFPTALDYRSWNDQDTDEARECGWVKLYSEDGQYKQHKNLLPPTEFLKTKDFVHSDYGLRSIAKSENYVAVSSYLYGNTDSTDAQVIVYEKLSSGSFIVRHIIKVESITRAPTVEIHGDHLFVGNPTNSNGAVLIYSLSELSRHQNFYGFNAVQPIAILTESDLGVTQSSTPSFFGFSIKAYSNETDKLLIIGAPHYSEFRNDSSVTSDFEIGAVYIFKYDDELDSYGFLQRLLLPNWETLPYEDGYGSEKLAMKFGYSFDFRFKLHGDFQSKGILLIGAPKFYQNTPVLKREGKVYAYRLGSNYGFTLETAIDCPENELNVQFDDVGLFEFGRSIVLDNQDNAWIASNPPQGSTVVRYGVTNLEFDTQTWTYEDSTKISEDRDGGFLTTNLDDIVFGSANNIKVFQDDGNSITPLKNTKEVTEEVKQSSEDKQITTTEEPSVSYLNKDLPSEWGSAPTESSDYLVPLPFGYGVGTTHLASWIEENSTGDVRKSKYLQKVVNAETTSENINYSELMETGNPTIKIKPWSSTIGSKIDIHSPHGLLIAEYGNPLVYKSSTVCTLILEANTPNNMMASWKVNDTFIDGSDRIELLIRGEDMNVSVDFKRNVRASKDQIRCVECREGKIIVFDKKA